MRVVLLLYVAVIAFKLTHQTCYALVGVDVRRDVDTKLIKIKIETDADGGQTRYTRGHIIIIFFITGSTPFTIIFYFMLCI